MSESFDLARPVAHDDDGYLRPQAWDEAKAAFGPGGDVARMLARLERSTVASPRLVLATAIHCFLQMDEVRQSAAVRDYLYTSSQETTDDRPPPRNGTLRNSPIPPSATPRRASRPHGRVRQGDRL